MNSKVFVLGSVNYDLMMAVNRMPKQGETMEGEKYIESVGGKGSNQAAACSKLGMETFLIGRVGQDIHGQIAAETLADYQVDTTYMLVEPQAITGIAMIIASEKDNRIIINSGANDRVSLAQVKEALKESKEGDIFLTQFETNLSLVFEAVKYAKTRGLITVVNPAPAYLIDEDVYPAIDYLILNETETEILTGIYPATEQEQRLAGESLSSQGVTNIVITLGEKGSVYLSGERFIYGPAFEVDVIDTTGSGDAFIAAFIFALANDFQIEKALEFANATGALATTQMGAKAGLPSQETVLDFLSSVNI